ATTGLLTLGNVSPGARMEADRTSFRYYNASNLLQFSIIGGVLTTAAATGARVELSSAGLKAFNAGGTNTVAINTDGSASFRGAIDLTNSTYSGTVPGATILTPGSVTTNLLTLTVGGQNLFPQSSGPMDGTLTGWNLYNNGVSPAPAYDNFATTTSRYSGRVFRITNSTGITGQAGITVPTANMPRVTAGKTYTWSAWVYPSSATTVTTHIHWRDAGLAIIGSGSAAVSALLPANTWSRIWTTAAAPTTPGIAVNASPYVWFNNLASGATYYIEGLQFEDGDIPTSYNPSPSEIPAGSTIQSSYSVNLSKVMMDATGLRGYDGTGQTFNLATTGLLTLGQPSPARRMESDRTSFRYYTDANVQNFSIINGVLTTGAADSGARIRLDNTSLLGYDATGQVFSLTTAGVLSLGAPSAAARVDVDRTSMRFLQSDGTTVGLYARAGILSTTATATGARVEVDGAADKIAIYSSTQERVTLETVQGLTLRDSSGVARLYLSALGGLTTVAADTAQRVTLNGLGLLAYDTGGLQTVNIESATGRIQIGNPAGQRMEATRTALGFYDSTNVLRLSLGASGGLTTQAAETSQRVSLTSAGLVSYNTSNQQTVLIDAATGKIILGPPSGAARIEADRTSMTFYQSDGLTAGLVATAGKVVSNTSVAVARVEFDGVVNQFAAYDTVRQRLGIDGTNGLRLWDAAGVLGLQSSAGGLITGTTGNRAELLGDGLTLYTSDVRSIKLDASTGKLIAGINDTGVRIEIDNAGLRSYDINNVLGLHTSNYGGITAGDPNTYAEMDKYGMRAVGTGGRTANTTFEVFTDGIRDAIFKTGIDVGGVIALGISTDNIIHDENKLG
ncbi:MAG TPA: hypothetical protein VNS88_05485, partial [Nitrospiraceae bacterium]|nr:hypothetical protein [Nitrospiraceae bacterium]